MNKDNLNIKQKEFWSGKGGNSWIKDKENMDRMLFDYGNAALNLIKATSGTNIVDIGCGTGKTTEILSNLVGNSGLVSGLDISEKFIKYAKENINQKNIEFKVSDIQNDTLPLLFYNCAFSRFGVMFFENPKMAFQNIYNSLKINGTLSFVCWQNPKRNPWHSLTQKIISSHFDVPPAPEIKSPSPFAFQDKEYIFEILKNSNFTKIDINEFNKEMIWFPGQDLEYAANAMLERNPVISEQVQHLNTKEINNIINELINAYTPYYNGDLKFPSSTWIVKAEKE